MMVLPSCLRGISKVQNGDFIPGRPLQSRTVSSADCAEYLDMFEVAKDLMQEEGD